MRGDDLFQTPLDQSEIDFENAGGETYICGNPPYLGSTWQNDEQKSDLHSIFGHLTTSWRSLDYVSAWFMKAAEYGKMTLARTAFVATNSICQGQQVPILWEQIFRTGHLITFAYPSLRWSNLASHNAGVTVVIVGISIERVSPCKLFVSADGNETSILETEHINAYLVSGPNIIVQKVSRSPDERSELVWGNKPADGGNLLLDFSEKSALIDAYPEAARFIRSFPGSSEFISGAQRYCLWVLDDELEEARKIPEIARRLEAVTEMRAASPKAPTKAAATTPNRFVETRQNGTETLIVVPGISSENRPYLPCGVLPSGTIISNKNYAFYGAPLWNMALIASRMHRVWIATVCVRLRTDFSYSNTLGWNTFPLPNLSEQNKADLTRCAGNILLAREAHFPATIADLYDPENMPLDLRHAHDENDEVLERIYIGRRFRNDTERLEKLFELYTKMTSKKAAA